MRPVPANYMTSLRSQKTHTIAAARVNEGGEGGASLEGTNAIGSAAGTLRDVATGSIKIQRMWGIPAPDDATRGAVVSRQLRVCIMHDHGPGGRDDPPEYEFESNLYKVPAWWRAEEEDVWRLEKARTGSDTKSIIYRCQDPEHGLPEDRRCAGDWYVYSGVETRVLLTHRERKGD